MNDRALGVRVFCSVLFSQNGDTKENRKKVKSVYYKQIGRYTKGDPLLDSFRWIPDPLDGFGEYGTERVVVECEEHETAEDVERWFKDAYWITISSPWDCTGEWFSRGVHAVKVSPTKAIVLHRMAMDI